MRGREAFGLGGMCGHFSTRTSHTGTHTPPGRISCARVTLPIPCPSSAHRALAAPAVLIMSVSQGACLGQQDAWTPFSVLAAAGLLNAGVLCYAALCCAVLCCAALRYAALGCAVHLAALHCAPLFCAALCILLRCADLTTWLARRVQLRALLACFTGP